MGVDLSQPQSVAPEIYFPPGKIHGSVETWLFPGKKIKRQLFVLILSLLPTTLYADPFQQQVVNAARDFLRAKANQARTEMGASRVEVSVRPPSGNLKLPVCPVTPTVEDISRDTIGDQRLKLLCPSGKNWSLFLRGEIALYRPVLVVTRPLAKGAVIPASAVTLQQENLAKLDKGYLTGVRELDHRVTRIRIRAGTPLQPDMLVAARLVERGDRVVIRSGAGAIDVSVNGEALESGSLNDQIRVRNSVSHKIVYGVVTGRGQVRVN